MTREEIFEAIRGAIGVKVAGDGFTVTEICETTGFCRPVVLREVRAMVDQGLWEPIVVLRPRISGPMARQSGYRVTLRAHTTPWAEIKQGKGKAK